MIKRLLKNVFLASFLICIALLQMGCESNKPRDILVHVSEKHGTAGIEIYYKLIRDGKTQSSRSSKGRTKVGGVLKNIRIKVKKGDSIKIIGSKAGYDIKSTGYKKIIGNETELSFTLEAIALTKSIAFRSNPPIKGIAIMADSGGGTSKLGETNSDGSFDYDLKPQIWNRVRFTYDHPNYTIYANRNSDLQNFRDIEYNSIKLVAFPSTDLSYRIVVLNAIDNSPVIGAHINIEGIENTFESDNSGMTTLNVSKSYLRKNNLHAFSILQINIAKNKYESITHPLQVHEIYGSSDAPIETILIQPANKLNIRIVDEASNPLSNVKIFVNNTEIIISNEKGIAEYIYQTRRSGEKISLNVSEKNMLPVSKDVTLGSIEKTITLSTSAFNYYLSVIDVGTGNSIEDILLQSNTAGVSLSKSSNGKYQLLFDDIDIEYSLVLSDRDKRYEPYTFNISPSKENLGKDQVLKLSPKTYAHFIVKDNSGKLLQGAEVSTSAGNLGKTDKKGELQIDLNYQGDAVLFIIRKSYHKASEVKKFLKSGETLIDVSLIPLEMQITLKDNESEGIIGGEGVWIESKYYSSDENGHITYVPKQDKSDITLDYRGKNKTYLKKKMVHKYDFSFNRNVVFNLEPRPSIKVKTIFIDPRGNKGEIPGVAIYQDGERIGVSNDNGEFLIELDAPGKRYTLEGKKMTFIGDPVEIPADRPTVFTVELILQGITGTISVLDIYSNQVAGLNISVDGALPSQTNRWGQAVARLRALKVPVNIVVTDPQNRYLDASFTHTFQEAKDTKTIEVRPKPVPMQVTVGYSDGSIAIADIEVLPPPGNTGLTKFSLVAGIVDIEVYKPGRYEVKYTTNDFIFGTREIEIKLGETAKRVNFMIPNASMRILVDKEEVVPVYVYARSSGNDDFRQSLGMISGDGIAKIDLSGPGYTEYKLVFTRPGWGSPSEEVVKLLTPEQLFDLTLGGEYLNCKKYEAQQEWQEACDACAEVKGNDPKYCEAVSTLILLYRDKLNNTQKATFYANQYADMMSSNCGEEWEYYSIYLSLLSQMQTIPENYINDNQIFDLYQDFMKVVIFQIKDKSQKNEQIKYVEQACADIACKMIEDLQKKHARTFDIIKKGAFRVEADRVNDDLQIYIQDLPTDLREYYDNKASSSLAKM